MGQDQGVSGIHGPDSGTIAFGLGHVDPGFAEGDRSDFIRTRIDRHGNITPERARATIGSPIVLGSPHAGPAIRAARADRLR